MDNDKHILNQDFQLKRTQKFGSILRQMETNSLQPIQEEFVQDDNSISRIRISLNKALTSRHLLQSIQSNIENSFDDEDDTIKSDDDDNGETEMHNS